MVEHQPDKDFGLHKTVPDKELSNWAATEKLGHWTFVKQIRTKASDPAVRNLSLPRGDALQVHCQICCHTCHILANSPKVVSSVIKCMIEDTGVTCILPEGASSPKDEALSCSNQRCEAFGGQPTSPTSLRMAAFDSTCVGARE